jgi:hypothetical protein
MASALQTPISTAMSDRTPNIELRDINPRELEYGIVPRPAGLTSIGSPTTINIPDGGNNETVIWVPLNDHIQQWLSRIDSAERRRKFRVVLVVFSVMFILSLVAYVIFYYMVIL